MKKIITFLSALMVVTAVYADAHVIRVNKERLQTITGFGAACCDGAMKPYGNDVSPVSLLYGPTSKVGLNIMRMEISPNFIENADGWGDYDWYGCVPSAKIVKQRGGIVFGTPWSPPGSYKTNGTAQGGNADSQGNQRGKLRTDCYAKFFPWLNSYLKYMKSQGIEVSAVSIQNEPDWWVDYSGCLYSPQEQLTLVKNYAHMLDRETYPGVRLISGEPLGFTHDYSDPLMNDPAARKHIDIVAGHLYGHAPLDYMKQSAQLALKYGKEVWMTEHSVSDGLKDRLPNWNDQLEFARELNECMLAGCTGYIYWYMRAHWAFVGTGETQYKTSNEVPNELPNTRNYLLPRAYIMSHFAKNVTGSTRVSTTTTFDSSPALKNGNGTTGAQLQATAYVKGDSIIVMVINSQNRSHSMTIRLPEKVKSGTHWLSTNNSKAGLYQQTDIPISASTKTIIRSVPAKSVNTFVFMVDHEETAVEDVEADDDLSSTYYDLQGRPLDNPQGLCVERFANGTARKVYIRK